MYCRSRAELIQAIYQLRKMHAEGRLGGERMPEDDHPGLPVSSAENYHFFTLPMALNYQRNSYALWSAARKTFSDPSTRAVFDPQAVVSMDEQSLRDALTKYGVALQPIRQTLTWKTICHAICALLEGDVRNLFVLTEGRIPRVLEFVQRTHKAQFPYLSGVKICPYWLYVLSQYTDVKLREREALSVAPDTHVIQATIRLGLVPPEAAGRSGVQQLVAEAWREVLRGTDLVPIDLHTPLWLWSRKGFPEIETG
jgi:hypothetical protein